MQQGPQGKWGTSGNPLLINESTIMKSLGGKKIPAYQRGGSVDNIPAMLTGGEFVVNSRAVRKYGSGALNRINGFQGGGLVGDQKFVPPEQNGNGKKQEAAAGATNNNTVNISINMGNGGGGEGANVSEDASGSTPTTANGGRELGRKIKNAVLQVIEDEKRVGGKLRDPYKKDQ
mgnify:CR=1 FL=1